MSAHMTMWWKRTPVGDVPDPEPMSSMFAAGNLVRKANSEWQSQTTCNNLTDYQGRKGFDRTDMARLSSLCGMLRRCSPARPLIGRQQSRTVRNFSTETPPVG